jgi:hypothetical protein
MNKLNFTPVDKAFTLGSSQIKDTQEEIAQLTKLILESNTKTKPAFRTQKKVQDWFRVKPKRQKRPNKIYFES